MERMLLTEYIADGISKREMYQVIEQFVDAMIETEATDRKVVLRLEELEINHGRVALKYERAERPLSILVITDFIRDLVFRCVFRVGEELDDLGEFLRFLDNEREVTLAYIYEYVMDELDLDIPPKRQSLFEPEQVSTPVYNEMNVQRADETGVLDIAFWEQNKVLREADKIQRHSQKLQQTMNPEPQRQTAMQSDETGLLDASFWDKKMQSTPGAAQTPMQVTRNISLVNIKSKEEVRINGSMFVIGKDASTCDYVIENKTISRKHAEILVKGSRYYIRDLGSTNKTFIGNTEIKPHVEIEIFDGTRIKFSNEVYEVVVR